MSFRLLANRLFKHGRFFWHTSFKRDIYTNILENNRNRRIPFGLSKTEIISSRATATKQTVQTVLKTSPNGIFRFQQHARKLFIDNVLNRCTTQYAADLRTQARKKLFYGDSAPFFALIGVSLASGTGVLTKEDELEGVCWEIREAATKLQNSWNSENISKLLSDDGNLNIDKLEVGPPIAKGCAAVVYAAAFKSPNNKIKTPITTVPENLNVTENYNRNTTTPIEILSPIQNISRFVHNFGGSVDNLHLYNQGISFSEFLDNRSNNSMSDTLSQNDYEFSERVENNQNSNLQNKIETLQINSPAEQLLNKIRENDIKTSNSVELYKYPLALKMMFNYDIQSNAMLIIRAMYKETLPARQRLHNKSAGEWEKLIQEQTAVLPPHPNIVLMYGYFCDEVKNFRDGNILYPVAQPQRINPNGYGRNMSLYLLMKRYDYSLQSYLHNYNDKINLRTRILLFSQLLEAVAHLNRHGIAHRDLKSDNILIEMDLYGNDDKSSPILALSDFGCCLADKVNGLQIPYTSMDIDRGGNTALMAPEIINKQPGTFSILNYSKSDLWAIGAIAYEIFGLKNPFYQVQNDDNNSSEKSLKNFDYNEDDLPDLGQEVPVIVKELIYNILNKNPNKRLSPDVAANVIQIYLWAPSYWLKKGAMPSSPEILQWLLSLATKVMTENCLQQNQQFDEFDYKKSGRRTYTEYLLICSFLSRARLRRIQGALSWIQSVF